MAPKATIFISESSDEHVKFLKESIGDMENYRVVGTSNSGKESMELVSRLRPNILLLDIKLSDMDSFEITTKLREKIPSGAMAIILMSDKEDVKLMKKAFAVGAQNMLFKPFTKEELEEDLSTVYDILRERWKSNPELLQREIDGSIITVFSTKGGVGKTTIAVNLATLLASILSLDGKKIALVDGNFQFGNAAIMLDLPQDKNIYNLIQEMNDPGDLEYELLEEFMYRHESGLYFLSAPPDPQHAEMITMRHLSTIFRILKKNFDYVIVDTTSYIRDHELIFFDYSKLILLIVTLEFTAIRNVSLCKDILKVIDSDEEKYKLILNRAYQKMGIEHDIVVNKLGEISCFIPSNGEIVIPSQNLGKPFSTNSDSSLPIVKAMYDLGRQVVNETDVELLKCPASSGKPKTMFDMLKDFMKK